MIAITALAELICAKNVKFSTFLHVGYHLWNRCLRRRTNSGSVATWCHCSSRNSARMPTALSNHIYLPQWTNQPQVYWVWHVTHVSVDCRPTCWGIALMRYWANFCSWSRSNRDSDSDTGARRRTWAAYKSTHCPSLQRYIVSHVHLFDIVLAFW